MTSEFDVPPERAAIAHLVGLRRRYQAWCDLGPGGLPRNPIGWATSEALRLLARDPLATHGSSSGPLRHLPQRSSPRPQLGTWPIPHRQLDQLASTTARAQLCSVFDAMQRRYSESVVYRRSHFEAHHDAITLRDVREMPRRLRRGHGELAHLHPSDGSMHMVLDTETANAIIKRRWGERHPLAGVGHRLPKTYVLVHAPRDELEVAIVEQILESCIRSSL